MTAIAMMFVACEKEEPTQSTNIENSDINQYPGKIKTSNNKSVSFFSEEEAESHILDVLSLGTPETLTLKVINSDSGSNLIEYQITSIPFAEDDVDSPSDPESVWLFPSQFNQAMNEAFDMAVAVYPCEVKITSGYGLIAVNAYC